MIRVNSRSLNSSALSRRYIAEYCRHSIAEALGLETADAGSPPDAREAAQPLVSATTPFAEAA